MAPLNFQQLKILERYFHPEAYPLGSALPFREVNQHGTASTNLIKSLWVVCRGRVRLLCHTPQSRKPATVHLVEAGEMFGADQLFETDSEDLLGYEAIAADQVQAIEIPGQLISQALEHSQTLQTHLRTQVQQRQQVIFLRSLTQISTLKSHQLREIVPFLDQQTVPAGTPLSRWAHQYPGCYWLRRGNISGTGAVPSIGDHWCTQQALAADWTATTDLQLYLLPESHWADVLERVPKLPLEDDVVGTSNATMEDSNGFRVSNAYAKTHAIPVDRVNLPSRQVAPPVEPTSQSPSIVFPKPVGRHLLDRFARFPWVQQHSSSDCGAACLAMITRYWGKRVPIHVLRERANVGREGASLKGMAKAAESFGFAARPVRASLSRIAEHPNPWIAHWEGDHYVVVYHVGHHRVVLADPALGRRRISRRTFQEHWTGYALLLEPTEQFQEVEVKQASLGRYLRALSPYKSLITQVILVSLIIQVFSLVSPLFTQIILDRVVVQKSQSTLNVFATGLLIFGIWGIALTAVRRYLLSYFANRLDVTLISGFINHALSLPLKFFEDRRVGDIITRVQENQKIQRFLISQVVLAWLNFLTGFVYLGLMLYYNWQLTLLVLGLIPPIVILTLGSTPFLRQVSRQIFKEAADQNSVLVEMMNGIAAVKSSAVEKEVRWRWEEHLARLKNMVFKGQKLSIGLQTMGSLINTLGSTALLWFGAMMVINDQLTIGQLVAFNMMIGRVISPVLSLTNLWDQLQEILISIERLNDVFESSSEETNDHSLLSLPPIQGEVIFENVVFRYNEEDTRNTLQNINFLASPGQTIAIVGRSGSGKTTLVKLLERLYLPDEGRILIDGHDIRHVSPHSLRSQLGVVPQECFLFSGTILENITLYRTEISLEQVTAAAQMAEAHAFIQALPMGYGTKVGERGTSLSGGQRQRIAISRALIDNPRILILDEATSSLDTESEYRFQRNLERISHNRTTFIIAHRLSTVRNADCILVLDKGLLVERGTHQELMQERGLYYSLAQQQLDL